MKFTDKYKGKLPQILCTAPEFAISDAPLSVSAAYRVQNGSVPDCLYAYVKGGGKYRLDPVDSFSEDVNKQHLAYEIYAGSIPTEKLTGEFLEYYVGEEGVSGELSDCSKVKLYAKSDIPEQPPLILSEIYERPKGRDFGYLEVMNPSDAPADLYDYEFLIYDNKTKAEGNPTCRLPMSDEKGKDILAGGEFAAIWGLAPKNLDKNGRFWSTPADFFEDFSSDFTNRNLGYTETDGRIIPVKYYKEDENGKLSLIDGITDVPAKHRASVLYIVPRGKDADEAVYTCVYSTCFGSWDTPVKRSSYWKTDIRNPRSGVNICHYEMATPGFAGRGQAKPEAHGETPVIIPLFPDRIVYIGDGDCDLTFACVPTGDGKVTDARICVNNGDRSEKYEAYEKEDGLYHATIPHSVIRCLDKISYYIEVSDGTRTFDNRVNSLSVSIYDNDGPEIEFMQPSEGYAYDGRSECELKIDCYDVSGVDFTSCIIKLDDKDITKTCKFAKTGVSGILDVKTGKHKIYVILADNLGNVTKKTVHFTVSDMSELEIYRGQVHCHTADSDGTGMPEDAYIYARDTGMVDFFAVTDHSHYIDKAKYDAQVKLADKLDEHGKFAALYGWEMTWNNACGFWGHTNVLNTRDFIQNMNKCTEPELFDWLEKRPESVAMFNHPGYDWGNFDEFDHRTPAADKVHCLAEIKSPGYDFEYMHLLARGWHASPVSNEDNHGASWTTATASDGYVLAPALTRQNIIDAFRANRTYVSSDKTMKLYYKVNGQWLGSRLDNPSKLDFDIRISTESILGIGYIEIVAEDDVVVAAKDCRGIRSFKWTPSLTPDFDYYYLRITSPAQYCVTAPVWVENRQGPKFVGARYTSSYNETDTAAVSFDVNNDTKDEYTDVRVGFILSPANGFKLSEAVPFNTVYAGKLKPESKISVSSLLPEVVGLRRVTAVMTSKFKDVKKTEIRSIMLCPLQIVGVMPKSRELVKDGETIKNPFPYITIVNTSPKDITLKGGKIRQWSKFGKNPPEDRILATDAITVKARSSVVIWDRYSCKDLTVADFNERYGIDFVEGENLFVSDVHITDTGKEGKRIDLRLGDDIVNRVHWNYGLECGPEVEEDREYRFVYYPNMTSTSTYVGKSDPMPGYADDTQMKDQRTILQGRKDRKNETKAEKSDKKSQKRAANAFFSKKEGTAAVAGAAAIGAGLATAIAVLLKKKK